MILRTWFSSSLLHAPHLAARVRTLAMNRCLEPFNTFNWKPDSTLSEDENFFDLTLLVTRSSTRKQGSMACILVREAADTTPDKSSLTTMLDRIVSVSINQPLYKPNESDIHAEIAAIGQAAQSGRSTLHCTAYITTPPCRRCFAALYCAGIQRIVSWRVSPLSELAADHGIDVICLQDWDGHLARTNTVVQTYEKTHGEKNCGETI
jgi:tRNA(Arg) A34 adenosine deaminase TadA